jgi:hypothetical protein
MSEPCSREAVFWNFPNVRALFIEGMFRNLFNVTALFIGGSV